MADLYDIAVARKLSGGGGGGTTVEALSVTQNGTYTAPSGKAYSPVTVNVSGGSSDFSTAEVTITITAGECYLHIPTVVSTPMDAIFVRQVNAMIGEVSLVVPLYKGSLALSATVVGGASVNVTGDIQYMGGGGILITGNGTITIS